MNFVFHCKPVVPAEVFLRNIELVKERNYPKPQYQKRPPLAIVGGGPSVLKHIERLKAWPGDVWVMGSAFPWARENGIKATWFNIDPLPEQIIYAKGAEHAILASITHIDVFDTIPNIECFDLVNNAEYSNSDTTAMTATPVLAMEMGYTAVIYFGCESSFDETVHAYDKGETKTDEYGIWVRVGDTVYPTSPQFLLQARFMAEILRTCPRVFKEASGGLLRALVEDEKFSIVAVDERTHNALEFKDQDGIVLSREEARGAMPILGMAL